MASASIDGSHIKVHQHGTGAKGGFKQGIGRSKGGFTTKIHATVDGLGNPVRIKPTGGEVHDIVPAVEMIDGVSTDHILADRAYDADHFISFVNSQNSLIVCPPINNRKNIAIIINIHTKNASVLNVSLRRSKHIGELQHDMKTGRKF